MRLLLPWAFLAVHLFLVQVRCAPVEDWRSLSVYQLLTDRFDNGDGGGGGCDNLGDYCGGNWDAASNRLE